MRKNLQSLFSTRQYMLSKDFELYYYNDNSMNNVSPHSHDYYEFYFFLEGDVSLQIGTDSYHLESGDMVIIPPNLMHCANIGSKDLPYRRFVFWVSCDYVNQLLEQSSDYIYLLQRVQITKEYIYHNDRITFNTIQYKVLTLIEEIHSKRFGRDAFITIGVNDLILYVNRLIFERNSTYSGISSISLYQNLLNYIDEHLEEPITLESIASEFYVNKYHISHVFKDNMGLSLHQYIIKKRLYACREALNGNSGISDIYTSYGFGDYSSFYRAFKKEFGMSPKDFLHNESPCVVPISSQ